MCRRLRLKEVMYGESMATRHNGNKSREGEEVRTEPRTKEWRMKTKRKEGNREKVLEREHSIERRSSRKNSKLIRILEEQGFGETSENGVTEVRTI